MKAIDGNFTFCSFLVILIFSCTKDKSPLPMTGQTETTYSYLALGDSYTIGESVPAQDNFPNQTIRLLKHSGYGFDSAEIIAKTGWTTDELQNKIDGYSFKPHDFVSLLIGVNNQYRGQSVEDYKAGFENLLKHAIQFAGNKADHVIVLSIPDWGVTPFATGRDRKQIAREIDLYNAANTSISEQYRVHYIDITPWTREAINDPSLIAGDGLHPSAIEYKRWSGSLADKIKAIIKKEKRNIFRS
jgi:lysophospholipase L1-like esterase